MKYKYMLMAIAIIVPVSVFGVEVGVNSKIDAKVGSIDAKIDVSAKINKATSSNATSSNATSTKGNATSTGAKNEKSSTTATTTPNVQGKLMSEEHRSIVASFVKSLQAVAGRQGGIGAEVRVVAQSQNDSASTTISAMAKVEERGSLKKFFFGSDYKNLGVIRSEIATTSKNINKLKALLEKTAGTTDKAEINAQIKVLENEQVKMDAYITENEDVFSLFGWFNRLFNK